MALYPCRCFGLSIYTQSIVHIAGSPVVLTRSVLQIDTRAVSMRSGHFTNIIIITVPVNVVNLCVDVGVAGDPTVCRWVPSEICRSAGAAAASSSIHSAAVFSALDASWKQAQQELSSWEP